MSFVKKIRKLRRDPQAFFANARSPAIRAIGRSIGPVLAPGLAAPGAATPAAAAAKALPAPALPAPAPAAAARPAAGGKPSTGAKPAPAKPAPTAKPAAVKSPAAPTAKAAEPPGANVDIAPVFENFQTGAAVAMPMLGFELHDPWSWHAAAPRLSDRTAAPAPGAAPLLAVFPSGSPSWDAFVLGLLEAEGYAARLLRPFEAGERGLAIEDLAWHARRQPLVAHRLALRLVAEARAAGAVGLVVPHDALALTRAVVLAAQQAGLRSLCLLQPGPHGATAYADRKGAGLPAADALAWVPELWPAPPVFRAPLTRPVASLALRGTLLQDVLARQAPWSGQGEVPLASLGIGPNDDPVLVLAHQGVPGASDAQLEASLEAALRTAVAKAGQRDHLVLVLSARKRGHLGAAARSLLQRLPRKSVLTHEDPVPWRALAARCRRAVGVFAWESAVLRALGFPEVEVGSSPAEAGAEAAAADEWHPPAEGPGFAALLASTFRPAAPDDAFDEALRLVERLGAEAPAIDCIAVPDAPGTDRITLGRQRHLLALLGARRRVHAASAPADALAGEIFVQWGAEPNEAKSRFEVLRTAYGRPKLYLEDGFVRSIGLWTDPDEPTQSVVMDPFAVYYDATRPSLLETWLNSDREITAAERARARGLIDRLAAERISKYNYAPDVPLGLEPATGRRVLLVDQKAGDMSIRYGLASTATFERMIDEALGVAQAGGEVLVKQHPCAISAGDEQAHYTRDRLAARGALHPSLHLIGFDINPFALFDPVDEVWVATSGMGLEALFAGRRVRTFAAPFYAGWGLTEDAIEIPRRRRTRTLEDVFHAFYLRFSRYVDPRSGRRCELEDLLDAIGTARAERRR